MSDHDGPLENEAPEVQPLTHSLDVKNEYIGSGITVSLGVTDSITFLGWLSLIIKNIPFISGFFKLGLRLLRTVAYAVRWRMNSGRQNEDTSTEIVTQSRLKNDFGWFILNILGITLIVLGLLLGGPFAFLLGSSLNDILEIYEDIQCGIDDSITGFGCLWDVRRDYLRDRNQQDLLKNNVSLPSASLYYWLDRRTKVNLANNCILALGKGSCAIIAIIAMALGAFPPALIIAAITLCALIVISRFITFIYQKTSKKPLLKKRNTPLESKVEETKPPVLKNNCLPASPKPRPQETKSSTNCDKHIKPSTRLSSNNIINHPFHRPDKKILLQRSRSSSDISSTVYRMIPLPRSKSYPNISTLFKKQSATTSTKTSNTAYFLKRSKPISENSSIRDETKIPKISPIRNETKSPRSILRALSK